jgi:hypothetical protein
VTLDPEDWLRAQCAEYEFDVGGVFRRESDSSTWPIVAREPSELEAALESGGHLLPLPKEPAALANVLEVSIVDFLVARVSDLDDAALQRGTERGYPDLELAGEVFGGRPYAVDVKVAQRARTGGGRRTQSRITLYTGNTYFKWPKLHWPGTFRPFDDYAGHLDVIAIYTLDTDSLARVRDLELIVQEPWRVASHKRSSTTREYIGAVDLIDHLRAGTGEFASPDEFYRYWRAFPFRVSPQVQRQLQRLLDRQQAELDRYRAGSSPSASDV